MRERGLGGKKKFGNEYGKRKRESERDKWEPKICLFDRTAPYRKFSFSFQCGRKVCLNPSTFFGRTNFDESVALVTRHANANPVHEEKFVLSCRRTCGGLTKM